MLDLDYKVVKYIFHSDKTIKVGDISNQLEIPHSTIGSCITR